MTICAYNFAFFYFLANFFVGLPRHPAHVTRLSFSREMVKVHAYGGIVRSAIDAWGLLLEFTNPFSLFLTPSQGPTSGRGQILGVILVVGPATVCRNLLRIFIFPAPDRSSCFVSISGRPLFMVCRNFSFSPHSIKKFPGTKYGDVLVTRAFVKAISYVAVRPYFGCIKNIV